MKNVALAFAQLRVKVRASLNGMPHTAAVLQKIWDFTFAYKFEIRFGRLEYEKKIMSYSMSSC